MKTSSILVFLILFASCVSPEPRRPISHHSESYLIESIDRNKKLNTLEENAIKQYIAQDSKRQYIATSNNFWYAFINKVSEDKSTPKIGNEVVYKYEISNLNNEILYSFEELGEARHIVDKEDIELGLQSGLKLLKEGEEAIFLFPSFNAFGIIGDKDKIGMNQPLKYRVQLIKINKLKIK